MAVNFDWQTGHIQRSMVIGRAAGSGVPANLTVDGNIHCVQNLTVDGNITIGTSSLVDVFSGTTYTYGDPVLLLNADSSASNPISGGNPGYVGIQADRGSSGGSIHAVLAYSESNVTSHDDGYWRMALTATGDPLLASLTDVHRVVGILPTASHTISRSGPLLMWTGAVTGSGSFTSSAAITSKIYTGPTGVQGGVWLQQNDDASASTLMTIYGDLSVTKIDRTVPANHINAPDGVYPAAYTDTNVTPNFSYTVSTSTVSNELKHEITILWNSSDFTGDYTFQCPIRLGESTDGDDISRIRGMYGVVMYSPDSGTTMTRAYPIPAEALEISPSAAVMAYDSTQMANFAILNVRVYVETGWYKAYVTVMAIGS